MDGPLCCINGKKFENMNKTKQKVLLFQTFGSKIPRIREKLAKKQSKNGSDSSGFGPPD